MLRQRAKLFGDMAKGGYVQHYDILDGDGVVGTKTVCRLDRKSGETTTYFLGEREFSSASEFMDAYEALKKESPS